MTTEQDSEEHLAMTKQQPANKDRVTIHQGQQNPLDTAMVKSTKLASQTWTTNTSQGAAHQQYPLMTLTKKWETNSGYKK